MRVTYQDGKLYLSLTRSEVKQVHDDVGRPIELDIGNLSILHEDVYKCVVQ